MANELTINLSANLVNGNLKKRFEPGSIQVTQAAAEAHSPVVVVGTSEEDLPVGDVTTLGYICLRNLDNTNFVTYGPKNGGGSMEPFGKLKPGEAAILRLMTGITLRWKADTASVKVQVELYGN